MSASFSVFRTIVTLTFSWSISSAITAQAAEVDFFDLPFGAERSSIANLFDEKSYERGIRVYYLRKEKEMQFAGQALYDVNYGFEEDKLVVVEASTFKRPPVDGYCYDADATEAIRQRMVSLFGRRIRHAGDYTSPPEEFRRNYVDYEECAGRFPEEENVSCEVDVFERWKQDAKETDRALEATFQVVSFGKRPVTRCIVRLTFHPGRLLSERLARENAQGELMDEMFDVLGYGSEDAEEPASGSSAPGLGPADCRERLHFRLIGLKDLYRVDICLEAAGVVRGHFYVFAEYSESPTATAAFDGRREGRDLEVRFASGNPPYPTSPGGATSEQAVVVWHLDDEPPASRKLTFETYGREHDTNTWRSYSAEMEGARLVAGKSLEKITVDDLEALAP